MARRLVVLITTLAMAAALLPVAPPAAHAAPALRDPSPPPGAVVAGPEVEIRVRVDGPAEGGAQVSVGETPLSARRDSGWVIATGEVPPGSHMVDVQLDGAQRRWRLGVSGLDVARLSGADRYATAVEISQASHPQAGGARAAVLARGDDFADGLAGAPLAHAVGGPLLLTDREELSAATAAELDRVLAADGAVYVLGGDQAVAPAVVQEVAGQGFAVSRLHGPTRDATAAAVADELAVLRGDDDGEDAGAEDGDAEADPDPGAEIDDDTEADDLDEGDGGGTDAGEGDGTDEDEADGTDEDESDDEGSSEDDAEGDAETPAHDAVVLVSARAAADALAVAGPAAATDRPILLTEPGELPAATRDRLAGVDDVLIVGGPAAVDDRVAEQARAVAGDVTRVAGANRYETALAVAEHFDFAGRDIALADGHGFADALAGGPHAAAEGLAILLAGGRTLPAGEDLLADRVTIYGGSAAVSDEVVADLHRARRSQGAPRVSDVSPRRGATVGSLSRVSVSVDGSVDPAHSPLHVTVGGTEVSGQRRVSDDGQTLLLDLSGLPDLRPGRTYDVEVTAAPTPDAGAFRYHAWSFRYRAPMELYPGDRGADVERLQRGLRRAGYWLPGVDGAYGPRTRDAVIALQKATGLPRTGEVDQRTWDRLQNNPAPPRPQSSSGRVIEIDLRRDLLTIVENGRVRWAFHVSTGHGQTYTFEGSTYRATTTTGRMRITRQIDGIREAARGRLYRPKYFDDTRGIAIHGYPSVPTQPASSGCVRISNPAMDFLWSSGLAPVGTPVWVYPNNHYQ